MRWTLMTLVMVAGCGAKPLPGPTPAEHVSSKEARSRADRGFKKRVRATRPEIDISSFTPDFHEELRWPLSATAHPSLEPRFAIARELANGLSWQKLCERGVHKRVSASQRELLSYLHGWCDVLKRDVDGACAHLAPLLGSVRLGLTPAVRQDLANILVDGGDADRAEHYLSKYNVRDVEVLDLLAANYAEMGRLEDSAQINRRAINTDDHATIATRCRRLVKRIVTRSEADATEAIEALNRLAHWPKVRDPVCVRLSEDIACWHTPRNSCMSYFARANVDPRALDLFDVYYAWPYQADASTWWRVADRAIQALPVPGAAELAITAHEAGLRASADCAKERAVAVHHAIDLIRSSSAHASYEPRLQQLAAACPEPPLPAGVPATTGSASAGPPPPSRRPKPVATWPSSP